MVVCPTTVAPEHPDSYYSVSDRLAAEIPGAFKPNQYGNPENPGAHEASTGPEIWRQTAGRVTHFVAGIGTGGTITGVGRYLKAQNPDVQIVGADPEGSVYSGGSGRPYLVEGIGEDFWPATYDPSVVDTVVMVSDRDSFLTARRVPGKKASSSAARRARPSGPPSRWRGRWAPTMSSSSSSPIPDGATCRSSTTTDGWPTSVSCAPAANRWAR